MEYHDEGAILVRLFTQCVQFGDGIVECLFGKVTRSVGRIQDLVIEDGEVEGETKADLVVSKVNNTIVIRMKTIETRGCTGCVGGSSVTATSEAALYASRDLSALSLRLSPRANSAR
jgi:hypothetical protein